MTGELCSNQFITKPGLRPAIFFSYICFAAKHLACCARSVAAVAAPYNESIKAVPPAQVRGTASCFRYGASRSLRGYYSMIVATRPDPTVWPPSRIAKVRPCSIAIGWISSMVISTLSPGMHISVPSGREITPVTSVVLK